MFRPNAIYSSFLEITISVTSALAQSETMHQLRITARAVLLSLFTAFTLNAYAGLPSTEKIQAGRLPASTLRTGEAKGRVTAGGQSVELKFAYARKVKGQMDESEVEFEVLLTNQPVRAELLWKGDDFSDALFYEDRRGLRLRVNRAGRLIYLSLHTVIERPTERISLSLAESVWGEIMKIGPNHITGTSQREGETGGEKWTYQVAFNSPILKPGSQRHYSPDPQPDPPAAK